MEVNELLNPEEYDIVSGRYWKLPSVKDQRELRNIILDKFSIDPDILDDFVYGLLYDRWYGVEEAKDLITDRSQQDNVNLYEIKQKLHKIEQYKDISFKMILDPGKGSAPETTKIIATEAVKEIYKVLAGMEAPEAVKGTKTGRKPQNNLTRNAADIITRAFCLCQGEHSTTDKKYFTGLILALTGVLDGPDNYTETKYQSYRDYLVKKTNQYITAAKKLLKKGILGYSDLNPSSINELWGKDAKYIIS